MRSIFFGLATAFALGFVMSSGSALAECSDGHKKTADISSPNIADSQTQQTPKPDQGS